MHLHTYMCCVYTTHIRKPHTHTHTTHAKIVKIIFTKEHTSLVTLLCWVLLLEEISRKRKEWEGQLQRGSKMILSSPTFIGKAILMRSHLDPEVVPRVLPANTSCYLFSIGHGWGVLPLFPESGCIHAKLCYPCHAVSMPATLEPKLPCAQSQREEENMDHVPMHRFYKSSVPYPKCLESEVASILIFGIFSDLW